MSNELLIELNKAIREHDNKKMIEVNQKIIDKERERFNKITTETRELDELFILNQLDEFEYFE